MADGDQGGASALSGAFEADARARSPQTAVVVIDIDGRIRGWDDGAVTLFGCPPEEAMGADLGDLLVPAPLREAHGAGVSRWRSGEGGSLLGGTYSVPVVHRDGSTAQYELTLVPVGIDDDSMVLGLFTRGGPKPADKLPVGMLEHIFEQAPEIITLLDREGRQRMVNTAGALRLGYGADGRLPISGAALLHPDDRGVVEQRFADYLAGSAYDHVPFRYRVLSGSGEWAWLETVVADLTDVPAVGALVAFSREVTVDEERRAQLDQVRARLVAAIDAMPGAAVIEDAAGRVAHANRRFVDLVGHEADEVIGRELRTLMGSLTALAVDPDRLAARFDAAGRTPGHVVIEDVRLRDGRVIVVETVPIEMVDTGEMPGRLWLSRDVTARTAVDAELRRSLAREHEARQTAERAKDELQNLADARLTFVSAVSHELRTPLTSIASAVDYLTTSALHEIDAAMLATYLQLVQRNTGRLVALVDELLMVGRLSAGQMQASGAPFDIGTVVGEALDSLGAAAQSRSMTIELTVDEGPPACADSGHVHQIVVNLVENALKYGDEGSTVHVGCLRGADAWEIVVENRGVGVAEEDQARLFEPFFRSTRTAGQSRGSGLGLSIVRGLAELQGGSVYVDPAFVGGARFVCRLPD